MGATASRLLRGNHKIHTETEAKIAEFSGTESSLLFSSGFSLNVGLYSAISDKNDTFFSDALNHASIIDGLRLSKARKVIFPFVDLETLEILLRQRQSEGQGLCGHREPLLDGRGHHGSTKISRPLRSNMTPS